MAAIEVQATTAQLTFAREWIRDVVDDMTLICNGWDDVADMPTEDVVRYVRRTYGGGWSQLAVDAQWES